MESRRTFFKASAAALAAARSALAANDKVQMAIIGAGTRGGRVFDSLARHADCHFLAAAEVNKAKLDSWMTPERANWKVQTYGDYRKILDRKDIDAVLIATPDHWHSQITIDAISAGKDVYVEKPVSNTIPRINAMLDACKNGKQVVQVGTHQRSWDHFIEAKKVIDAGTLGNITHVVIVQPGSYARPREAEQPVPAGLDWDMWQGPAIKKAFKPSRLGFRAWYDYGGGLVADWGAHHVDVGLWFMNADGKAPIRTMANGAFLSVPDADPEQVPDTFSISWQYDNFLMTFANGEVYMADGIENWGVFFVGNRGSLQVNRQGWAVRPVVPHVIRKQGPAPQAGAGGVTLGAGGTAIAPGAAGGRSGRGGRGGRGNEPPIEAKMYINPRGGVEEDYPLDVHTRNFLDCIKSRQKPVAGMEIGYSSALPCLIALESLKQGKPLGWDAASRTTKSA
ncbi:MAG TPA: Gfo/Idh/MocA family oxidoreductase [Candidatus Acidoferrales bacterium]|nr:Gfo/Idh/MocA family oxidoreductase [Candidatus Acidoferrales bacterium]